MTDELAAAIATPRYIVGVDLTKQDAALAHYRVEADGTVVNTTPPASPPNSELVGLEELVGGSSLSGVDVHKDGSETPAFSDHSILDAIPRPDPGPYVAPEPWKPDPPKLASRHSLDPQNASIWTPCDDSEIWVDCPDTACNWSAELQKWTLAAAAHEVTLHIHRDHPDA